MREVSSDGETLFLKASRWIFLALWILGVFEVCTAGKKEPLERQDSYSIE
jgi:hypothetical protein